MLILEGADCTGKTTLAKQITKKFNAPFCHLGLPPVGKRHWDLVREALLSNPVNTVYDRMVMGSLIFGTVKPDAHNQNAVNEPEFNAWLHLINNLGATLVLCIASEDTLLQRFRVRGDAYLNEAELEESAVAYRNLIQRIRHNGLVKHVLLYNSEYSTPGQFANENAREVLLALRHGHLPTEEQKTLIRAAMA